jgi:hypothetical protein
MNAITVEKERISEGPAYRQTEMDPGRDAWDLVKQVWMTEGPGRIILPVDPVAISRRLGIEVYSDDDLPADVSGIVRKDADFKNPEIFLNEADPYDRRRFTCAHALGHYSRIEEVGRGGTWEIVEGRDFFAARICETEKVFATEFAAEMLMPRAVFRELADLPSVASLAAMFAVTGDIVRFRLDQIGRRA